MTKAELILKGKKLGVALNNSMLKSEMEKAITKAEKPAKASSRTRDGEY
jgi:hypothetical protein